MWTDRGNGTALMVAREAKDEALLQTARKGLAPNLPPHHGFDPGRCSRNCIVLQERQLSPSPG